MSPWLQWRKLLTWLPLRNAKRARQRTTKLNRVGRCEQLEERRLLAVDLSFSVPELVEAANTTYLTATLSAPATSDTIVKLAFGGTAKRGQDYSTAASQITINAGDTTGSVAITTIDDARTESGEYIAAEVDSIIGATDYWTGQPAYAWISDDDAPLVIQGTTDNDVLTITLGDTSFTYKINSEAEQTYNYSQYESVQFVDAPGTSVDTVYVGLSSAGSQVSLQPNAITIEGDRPFDILSTNIEKRYVNGGAIDSATIEGTSGNDTYWGLPAYSVMVSGGRLSQVTGIRNVTANGNGGTDVALLYGNGSRSVDSFTGGPTSATITKLNDLNGSTSAAYINTASGFRYVHAYADDANDQANFNDQQSAADTFLAQPGLYYMAGTTGLAYQNTTYGYRNVIANSTGGNDAAYLYDSAGVDTLSAYNVWTRLNYADRTSVLVTAFRDVIAVSTWNRTLDNVFLADSWTPDVDTTSTNALERGRDDHLNVVGTTAEMIYGNRRVFVSGFENLNAQSFQGGTDTFTISGSAFVRPFISGFVNEINLNAWQRNQMQGARAYLRDASRFDIQRYMRRGTDYLNPEFADIATRLSEEWSVNFPSQPRLTAANIDLVIGKDIYDYSRLERVENSLLNVDRRAVLQRLFDEVTRNSKTNVERQTAIIEFGHKSFQHGIYMQPLTFDQRIRATTGRFIGDGMGLTDPLTLLELAEGRCGQVNKVIADMWRSLGFRVRILGVNSHTTGEVMYEGQWHYNDAGLFGGQEIPLMPVSPGSTILKVPSFAELAKNTDIVDRLALYTGVYDGNGFPLGISAEYASHWYFDDLNDTYMAYEKGAAADRAAPGSRDYGWRSVTVSPITWITREELTPHNSQPSAPYLNNVQVSPTSVGGSVTIGWQSSYDNYQPKLDSRGKAVLNSSGNVVYEWANSAQGNTLYSDVVGYRVYVSTTSRGWNYNTFKGLTSVASNIVSFKANDAQWNPTMYDRRYASPPSDVMSVFVKATANTLAGNESVTVQLPTKGTYYVTVVAIDSKGMAIGKSNYSKSEEIKITV
jgi:hypothetical protein